MKKDPLKINFLHAEAEQKARKAIAFVAHFGFSNPAAFLFHFFYYIL